MAKRTRATSTSGGIELEAILPTVELEVRRLIARFGASAVKKAVKSETRLEPGRRPVDEAPDFYTYGIEDAREWLAGREPEKRRSNHALAKEYADKHPGHSHPATMRRISRKLKDERRWRMLVAAEQIAQQGYPYATYLRTLEELIAASPPTDYQDFLVSAREVLAEFKERFGEPDPSLSMEVVRNIASTYHLRISPEE